MAHPENTQHVALKDKNPTSFSGFAGFLCSRAKYLEPRGPVLQAPGSTSAHKNKASDSEGGEQVRVRVTRRAAD